MHILELKKSLARSLYVVTRATLQVRECAVIFITFSLAKQTRSDQSRRVIN